jgi:hypothetical protein
MAGPAQPQSAQRRKSMTVYAFPFVYDAERLESGTKNTQNQGMTLKDWFAGRTIAAMLGSDPSSSSQRDSNGQLCSIDQYKLANMAKSAYQVAEAMMQARSAESNKP